MTNAQTSQSSQGYTKRDLIDLAIEWEMIRSTWQFNDMSPKAQAKVLAQAETIAKQLTWD